MNARSTCLPKARADLTPELGIRPDPGSSEPVPADAARPGPAQAPARPAPPAAARAVASGSARPSGPADPRNREMPFFLSAEEQSNRLVGSLDERGAWTRMRPIRAAAPVPSAVVAVLLSASGCASSAVSARTPGESPRPSGSACPLTASKREVAARFSALGEVLRTQWCRLILTGGSGRIPGPERLPGGGGIRHLARGHGGRLPPAGLGHSAR